MDSRRLLPQLQREQGLHAYRLRDAASAAEQLFVWNAAQYYATGCSIGQQQDQLGQSAQLTLLQSSAPFITSPACMHCSFEHLLADGVKLHMFS